MSKKQNILWSPRLNKLIFLKEQATPEYWDRQWKANDWLQTIAQSRHSRYWRSLVSKYIPEKNKRILEGGCGNGHLVDAMQYWGYEAIGVDFARETVNKIKSSRTDLDVRWGDVRQLDFPNNYFDGYFSMGVIEHFWDGYQSILQEMVRVLKPGGIAFVSFPRISAMDRWRIRFSRYPIDNSVEEPCRFYQFGLDVDEVRRDFRMVGMRLLATYRRGGWIGLERIWPAAGYPIQYLKDNPQAWMAKIVIYALDKLIAPFAGHSVMVISQKNRR